MTAALRLRLYSTALGLYLTAGGRLDTASAHRLTTTIDLALRRLRPTRLVLDLRDVDHIDAAGVATLIACRRDARARGAELRIAQPSACVRATVRACGADDLLAPAPGTRPQLPPAAALRRSHRPGRHCLRPPRVGRLSLSRRPHR